MLYNVIIINELSKVDAQHAVPFVDFLAQCVVLNRKISNEKEEDLQESNV